MVALQRNLGLVARSMAFLTAAQAALSLGGIAAAADTPDTSKVASAPTASVLKLVQNNSQFNDSEKAVLSRSWKDWVNNVDATKSINFNTPSYQEFIEGAAKIFQIARDGLVNDVAINGLEKGYYSDNEVFKNVFPIASGKGMQGLTDQQSNMLTVDALGAMLRGIYEMEKDHGPNQPGAFSNNLQVFIIERIQDPATTPEQLKNYSLIFFANYWFAPEMDRAFGFGPENIRPPKGDLTSAYLESRIFVPLGDYKRFGESLIDTAWKQRENQANLQKTLQSDILFYGNGIKSLGTKEAFRRDTQKYIDNAKNRGEGLEPKTKRFIGVSNALDNGFAAAVKVLSDPNLRLASRIKVQPN